MTRIARVERVTKESSIKVEIDLDGRGQVEVDTGIGFYDHVLTSFAYHGLFDLTLTARGDLHVDDHHTVEDSALVLGEAISTALSDRQRIVRFGQASVPMDEALATTVLDLSGRPYTMLDLGLHGERIGTLTAQNLPHAIEALARTAGATIHLTATGRNDHHTAEAAFKSLGRAFSAAVAIDPRRGGIPSTKGSL
jgi:imidazoleglycerol-phosphate dehydratase